MEGLEPSILAEYASEAYVYTSSTTCPCFFNSQSYYTERIEQIQEVAMPINMNQLIKQLEKEKKKKLKQKSRVLRRDPKSDGWDTHGRGTKHGGCR